MARMFALGGAGNAIPPIDVPGPSARLRRLTFDAAGPIGGRPSIAATYGKTGGTGTYDPDQRNSQDWDTVDWASPGMVDLAANPRRITITEDGVYLVEGKIEFNSLSSENVLQIYKNGYDTHGSHSGGMPATDGLEPFGGFMPVLQGVVGSGFAIDSVQIVVDAHVGDFFFLSHQSDAPYSLQLQGDTGYVLGIPVFSVTKLQPLPA